MVVHVERADIPKEEAQKRVDRFNYLMGLALKDYIDKNGDLTPLDKRDTMTFTEWCQYVREIKEKRKDDTYE